MGAGRPSVRGWQRLGALAGAPLFLASVLGCMSLQFGGKTEVVHKAEAHAEPSPVYEQNGAVKLPPHEEVTVYYPIPYLSTPNLTVLDTPRHEKPFRVLEQRPDRFRVQNGGSDPLMVEWWAKGMRVTPGTFVPPVVPAAAEAPAPVPAE